MLYYERQPANVIMAKNKKIEDCSILIAKCLAVHEVILMAIHKSIWQIIIQSDSQLVVNFTVERYV